MLLGGILTAWASWRWVLFVNVPIGLAVLTLAPRFVDQPARQRGRLDIAGAVTSTAGMVALVYGLIRVAAAGWSDPLALALFGTALALIGGFLLIERRAEQPILPLRLFGDRTRAGAYLTMALVPAAMLGMFFFLTQFLQDVLGYTALQTGLAFLPMTALLFFIPRAVPRPAAALRRDAVPRRRLGAAVGGDAVADPGSANSDYAYDAGRDAPARHRRRGFMPLRAC